MYRTATVAQIEAEAARFQAEVGDRFKVNPNGYGVHIRCAACGDFATGDRAYRFSREHVCQGVLDALLQEADAYTARDNARGWADRHNLIEGPVSGDELARQTALYPRTATVRRNLARALWFRLPYDRDGGVRLATKAARA